MRITMKKQLTLVAAALVAFAMTGCDKKGTVEGVVLDPFTGKSVEIPTVWMDSTIYGTQSTKYKYKDLLKEGKFKFENVPVGTYRILTRRSKYILGRGTVTTTEENPDAVVTLYSYSDQVDPGLYKGSEQGPVKISNEWVIWSVNCGETSGAGYRLEMPQVTEAAKLPPAEAEKNAKKGKKGKKAKKAAKVVKPDIKMLPLPAPRVVDGKLDVFYRNANSVSTPIIATTYPAVEAPIASHKDCTGFGEGETKGLFADKSKGTALTVTYRAEGLYEITGNLPKGKQIIQFTQDKKALQTYYFEVK